MVPQIITTRREFLHRGLTLVGVSTTVPAFLERSAMLLAGEAQPADEHRVLVVVQLAGGNDGLNTVIPFRNDAYYKARPQLAIARKEALALNDDFGLHPAAKGLKHLYDEGLLSIVHGVGYPNPNRSHFKSMDIWHKASPDGRLHDGWLGRYFDNTCSGSDPDPLDGVALTEETPLAMRGDRFEPLAFQRPEELRWRGPAQEPAQRLFSKMQTARMTPAESDSTEALSYLHRTAMDAQMSAAELQDATRNMAPATRRPLDGRRPRVPRNSLSESLTLVANMIAARMPTRVYYVSLAGFDTHAAQVNRQRVLLQNLGDALAAFVVALREQGDLDRTLVMAFSEFGRRVAENASGGTDHGKAAPLFFVGNQVQAGLVGEHPSLEDLDAGDLRFRADFRCAYAAVLRNWLKADDRAILGRDFAPLNVIES
jgi:uncharacterized protein (DUF1501 family)